MENKNCYVDLAKHSIGLDSKKPYIRHGKKFYRPYRNFFATGKNYEDWETMKDAGYADRDKEKNQHGGYNILADTFRVGLVGRTAWNTYLQ